MAFDGRRRPRLLRALMLLLTLLFAVPAAQLAAAGTAAAHATLDSTDPADGALLRTAPAQVELTFDEPVEIAPDSVRILGPDGLRVDDRHPGHAAAGPSTARARLTGHLAQGSYVVSWRVVSADGHPVSGAFTFAVGKRSASAPALPAEPSADGGAAGILHDTARWAAYTALCLLLGAAAFIAYCLRWPEAAVPGPLRRLVRAGWLALLLATAAVFLLRGPYESGDGLGSVADPSALLRTLQGRTGTGLAVRAALLLLPLPVLLLRHRIAPLGRLLRSRRPVAAAGAVWALALTATWAAADHASVGPQVPLAIPLDMLHLLAMSVWLGGLVALLVLLRQTAEPVARLAATAGRFSRLAGGAVAVLALTGLYQSWRQVGSWTALTDTSYGRLLLAKLAAVAVLLAAARYSRRWTAALRAAAESDAVWQPAEQPQPVTAGAAGGGGLPPAGRSATATDIEADIDADRRRLRRSVAAEAAVGVVVLALTAALTAAAPARSAEAAREQAAQSALPVPTGYVEVPFDTGTAKGKVVVTLDPGRTGDNSLTAVVMTLDDQLAFVPEVRLRFSLPSRGVGPLSARLVKRGASWEDDDIQFPLPGEWTVQATVRTSDIDEGTGTATLQIRGY